MIFHVAGEKSIVAKTKLTIDPNQTNGLLIAPYIFPVCLFVAIVH